MLNFVNDRLINPILLIVIAMLTVLALSLNTENKALVKREAVRAKEIMALQEKYRIKEEQYLTVVRDFDLKINTLKHQHETNVNNIKQSLNERLLESERRADSYQRLAEQGPDKCRTLAGHTAELDRLVTEGRALVRELSETVRTRDSQVAHLVQMIKAEESYYE